MTGRSTSLITAFLDPSNALTMTSLPLMGVPWKDNLARVDFGMTFKDEPVSTSTLAKASSPQLTIILSALLCSFPSSGRSLSLKPKLVQAVILDTMLSID